jgi:hypothetical protein
LEIGCHFFVQDSLNHLSPVLCFSHHWDNRHMPPCPTFFLHWDWFSQTFLPWLASDCDHPNLSLPWDDRCMALCPGIGWDGILGIVFTRACLEQLSS